MPVLIIAIAALIVLCFCISCLAVPLQTTLLTRTVTAARMISLSQLETAVNIVGSCATTLALFVAGLWSYLLFVRKRQKYPRATLSHRITHRHVGLGKVLLHVDVVVSNTGDVLVSLVESLTRVQQVLPLPERVSEKIRAGKDLVENGDSEVQWDKLDSHKVKYKKGDCEIEPGDTQEINHDFILGAEIRTVEVYSHVTNQAKRPSELGWDLTTLYDLPIRNRHPRIQGGPSTMTVVPGKKERKPKREPPKRERPPKRKPAKRRPMNP